MQSSIIASVDPNFAQQLVHALSASVNPNNVDRQNAELFIKQAQKTPGYCSALLQITCDPNVNAGHQIDINHAAAIQLGTLVEYHWKFKDEVHAKKIAIDGFDFIILSNEDKSVVRQHIMQCLYKITNRSIIKQYVRCITTIARFDYPELWPNLLQEIIAFLSQQEEKAVVTGLYGLQGLCKKYEYELEEGRQPLYDIISSTFNVLGNLINQLINVPDVEDAQHMLFLICKIFYVSNQLYLCPYLAQGNNLDPWIAFFKTLMDRPMPQELDAFVEQMEVIEQRDSHILWKIKGVSAKTTYRIFSKYGNTSFVDDQFVEFSKQLQSKFAVPLLESHLQLVFKRKTHFVGSKALNFAIKYLSAATKLEITMTMLKPYVENLLYETVIPIMLVTHKDVTLYRDDPIEYIRKQLDFTETLFSPKNTVVDLVIYLCNYKSNKKAKQPDYLQNFLMFCANNLNQYNQQTNPDWRIKEAILFIIGSLRDNIDKFKTLRQMIEPMMQQHVFPELRSPQGFLRLRACWLYGEFGDFHFKTQNHIKTAIDSIYQCLYDPDLPVRLTAATSIYKLLINDEASEFLKPALKNILEQYLKLMHEVDSEELVGALEEIVKHFKDDIAPYALDLCEQLVTAYQRLISVNVEEDDGESALAAVGCVTAIRRILDSVQENKELLNKLQQIIYPILMHGLTPDGLDAIEDGLDCIALLIYHGPTGRIALEMWKLFPQLVYVVCGELNDPDGGYGFEYLSQIAISIQNYIAKDPETLLTQGEGQPITYIEQTFNFITRVLSINRNSTHRLDGIVIMKILIAMLENLSGKIDQVLPTIINICVSELNDSLSLKKPPRSYISMILQTIAMCFHYNSLLTFQVLEQNSWTGPVFLQWLKNMSQFKYDFELRRVIFGLTAIIRTNPQALPAIIIERLPEMTKNLAQLSIKSKNERLKILKDNEKYLEKGGNDYDSASDDDEEEQNDGEVMEDDDSEKEASEMKDIKKKLAKFKDNDKNDDSEDDDDSSDSDYEYTGGDLALYDSALDDIDELTFIKQTLESISQVDINYFQRLISGMNQDEFNQFNENMQNAESLKAREEDVRIKCEALDNKKK